MNKEQIVNALETCRTQLRKMEEDGFLENQKAKADDVLQLISGSSNLKEVLMGSIYVQVP